MKTLLKTLAFILLVVFNLPVYAAMNLTLTQGLSGAIPIDIRDFSNDDSGVTSVITHDLVNSGKFKNTSFNSDAVLKGTVSNSFGTSTIKFVLTGKDGQVLSNQDIKIPRDQWRQAAHRISDLVYQTLTGQKGIFSTRIAYILVQNNKYILNIADYDGFNPRPIITSHEPLLSPAWSKDGRKIAYVSFENGNPEIYISTISTGSRELISRYPGINGAPAFSPNDRRLALVLSKGNVAKIFMMMLGNRQLEQITSGNAIDTEPNFSPDGQSLLFTSDRGGSPQIYRNILSSGQIQRMTYNGNYNARASFSPDGNQVVMIHKGENTNGYGIGLQDLQTGAYLVLDNSGDDQSPSFAPNGQMVIFAKKVGANRQLALVSTDGRIKLALPSDIGEVQEPVWSPFLN